ncbi:hypothetical protein BDQ17DRAFT_584664 [Cyathus striatus]|nr:hypothetical protein BDQ17DRAFT_584664 [Cyathus striatus]
MPTPQSSSVAVDDPASSLRAAALLTLKSKRKRAVVETAPPPSTRPLPVEDTLQLDYGQEETPSNVPLSPSHSGSNEILNELHPTNDIEEGQIREEGEISDEDEASASPSKPPPSPEYFHAGPSDAHASPAKQLPARPSPPAAGSPRFPALLERITDAPQYIPMDEDQPMNAEDSAMQEYSPVDDIPLLVDLDHVRPGIPLKLEEYNVAKDIILDLLGWGVEPEYLIDCGLTRQIVYYVFAELNLELPHNLDTSDLVPFTPEVATVTLTRQMPTVHEKPSSGQSLLTRLNLGSHIPRLVTPPPDSMEGVQSPGTNELLDIERQRRQELLARKAAQASRKAKQVAPPVEDTSSVASSAGISPSEPSKDQDMETTPVASEAVEDFLKSIATPVEPPFKPTSITTLQVKENGMDLDEIPGLGSLSRSSSQADVTGNAPAYTDQIVVSPSTIHPLVSAESANSIFSPIAQDATIAANSFVTQRRGAKRPVASDFVDLDPSQRVGPNGNRLLDVPSRPGTGANFSSVSMKRCVIDLSDSEGEQDRSAAIPMKRARSKGYVSPPRRLRNETPSGSGWNTPSVAPTSSAAPGGQSVLEFKIKQMKEEIARREQEMKRAIASRPVSTAGSSNTTSIGASAPTAVVVKQEEDDSLTSTAMQTDDIEINAQSSETQSLDPSIVPLAMSENPSTNVSVAGTPSIAENDSRRGSASWPVSSPSPTTQDQGEYIHRSCSRSRGCGSFLPH